MANVLLPNFVFLWIPSEKTEHEEALRFAAYRTAMKLFDNTLCRHVFIKIRSFYALIDALNTHGGISDMDPRYRTIFILIGHGITNYGWMTFIDKNPVSGSKLLIPRLLVDKWRPSKSCDFIATQCYSHCFLDPITNPCLLKMTNVRWIPLSSAASAKTYCIYYDKNFIFDRELLALLECYMISYPEIVSKNTDQLSNLKNVLRDMCIKFMKNNPPRAIQQPTPTQKPTPTPTPKPTLPITKPPVKEIPISETIVSFITNLSLVLILGYFIGTYLYESFLLFATIYVPQFYRKRDILLFIIFIRLAKLYFM